MKAHWLITILSVAIMANAGAYAKPESTQPLDKVVAVVNDSVITNSELALAYKAAIEQLKISNKPIPAGSALRKEVLDRLILEAVQLQIAKRNNMEVSSEDVNKAIQDMANEHHITVDQLKKSVEHDGIDYPTFRKRINDQMIVSRLQQSAIGSKITITDNEVSEYLRSQKNKKPGSSEYHLLHLLVPLSESATKQQIQAASERAKKIVAQLKGGANLEEIARSNATGPNALGGGDLGWRKAADLPTLFAKQLSTLKIDQIAGPIQAPNGFHILKLVDVHNDPTKMTEQSVKNLIYHQKFNEQLQVWLQQLRDSAYVKISL